jgi:hypothetical protein
MATFLSAATALWTQTGSAGIADLYDPSVSVTSLVVDQLDPATDKTIDQRTAPLVHPGIGTGGTLPTEVAVVATLRTALPGPAGRGRMFMPCPALSTVANSTGRLNTTAQATFVGALTVFLQAMKTATHSPCLHTKGQADRLITRVDVGDVFDVMTSRRDKLIEARITGGPLT